MQGIPSKIIFDDQRRSHVRRRRIVAASWCVGIAYLGSMIGGCEGTGTVTVPWGPDPKVRSVNFYPAYFCSGDDITITWDTQDIDEMEILTRDGRVLVSTKSPTGTVVAEDVQAEDLPLRATGSVGDEERAFPVEGLVNIDNPTWTASIPSSDEMAVPDSMRTEEAYPEQIQLADGSFVSYMVYRVYVTYKGLYWSAGAEGTLPALSQKAKIDKVRNRFDQRLAFSSYVSGAITVAANAEGDIDPPWPGNIAWFAGDYGEPIEQHVAMQYGDQKKPPDPWFRVELIYNEAVGTVNLHAYCDN